MEIVAFCKPIGSLECQVHTENVDEDCRDSANAYTSINNASSCIIKYPYIPVPIHQ